MSLEKSIQGVIEEKLNDGTIEKVIESEFEKAVKAATDSLFRSYGTVTKLIEEKIESVMVPYVEKYDYSEYIVKLDQVLVEVLENTALDHKNILSNFKSLLTPIEGKTVTIAQVFKEWQNYVAANVSTTGLEVNYDDEPSYDSVEVRFEYQENDRRSWSKDKRGTIFFECEHDENMNVSLEVYHWDWMEDKAFHVHIPELKSINSLRRIDGFSLYLMRLKSEGIDIVIDGDWCGEEWVTPTQEPEWSLS